MRDRVILFGANFISTESGRGGSRVASLKEKCQAHHLSPACCIKEESATNANQETIKKDGAAANSAN